MKKLLVWIMLAAAASARPVVLISLDGLRPEFYLDSSWPAPNLQRLRQEGAWARSVTPVFPSITYANHTSLATGVAPARHGIDCNVDFDYQTGPTAGWNWQAGKIQAPTLWHLARRRHLTTAAFSWPVSVGAPVDALVPEIFHIPGANHGTTEELIRHNSTPGLIDEIQELSHRPFPLTFAEWDAWLPEAVGHVWRTRKPDLLMIHMLNLDWTQHRFGPNGPETREALRQLDADLGRLLAELEADRPIVMVVGDHGFLEVNTVLNPNQLFRQRGWIQVEDGRIRSWKVFARANGGSAAVYCKDKQLVPHVKRLLQSFGRQRWQLLDRDALDQRHTFPGASLALAVAPGYALSADWNAPLEAATPRPLGQHGHLPELVPTGWLVVGPGIEAGPLGARSLLEIAPTVGRLLKLDCSSMAAPGLELFPER